MSHTLSKEEQAELNAMLESRVMRKALSDALAAVQSERRGATTLEACAMHYNHLEGASGLVSKLYAMSDIAKEVTVSPRRLRPILD